MDERSSEWLHIADLHSNTPAGKALREVLEAYNAKRQVVHDLRGRCQSLTTHLRLTITIILGTKSSHLTEEECVQIMQLIALELGVGLADQLRALKS